MPIVCRCSEPSQGVWDVLLNRSGAKLETILNAKHIQCLLSHRNGYAGVGVLHYGKFGNEETSCRPSLSLDL